MRAISMNKLMSFQFELKGKKRVIPIFKYKKGKWVKEKDIPLYKIKYIEILVDENQIGKILKKKKKFLIRDESFVRVKRKKIENEPLFQNRYYVIRLSFHTFLKLIKPFNPRDLMIDIITDSNGSAFVEQEIRRIISQISYVNQLRFLNKKKKRIAYGLPLIK